MHSQSSHNQSSFVESIANYVVTPKKNYQIFQSMIASLGFTSWTYSGSVFNSIQGYVENVVFPDLSENQLSLIASIIPIFGCIGAMLGGTLCKQFGRWKILIFFDIIALIGVFLTTISNYWFVIAGRGIIGFTVGIGSTVVPLYNEEMAADSIKGTVGSLQMTMAGMGMLIGYGMGFFIPNSFDTESNAWKVALGFQGFFNIVRLIMFLLIFNYETPYYLISKGRDNEAKTVLDKLVKEGSSKALQKIQMNFKVISEENGEGIKDMFGKSYRKALFVCLVLILVNQVAGINPIYIFSDTIFKEGFSPDSRTPQIFTMILGILFVITSLISTQFIDKFGRRKMIVFGCYMLAIVTIGICLLGFFEGTTNMGMKFLFIIWPSVYAAGLSPASFLYISEVLPEAGVSMAQFLNWVSGFGMSQSFLSLANNLSLPVTFSIYALMTILGGLFFSKEIVESQNRTKAEMILIYQGERPREYVHTESIHNSNINEQIKIGEADIGQNLL